MKISCIAPLVLTMIGSTAVHGKHVDMAATGLRGLAGVDEEAGDHRPESRLLNEFVKNGAACLATSNTCTAEDVRLGSLTALSVNGEMLPDGQDFFTCNPGEDLEVKVESVILELGAKGAGRFDIGVVLSEIGGDSGLGDGDDCTQLRFPAGSGAGQLPDEEGGADVCGDLPSDKIVTYDEASAPSVILKCKTDNVGEEDLVPVGYCTTWDQNSNKACDLAADIEPGTKSKCKCDSLPINIKAVCSLEASCALMPAQYNCDDQVPAAIEPDGTLATIQQIFNIVNPSEFCVPSMTKQPDVISGDGCPMTPKIITRTYTLSVAGGTDTVDCTQVITVSNDDEPTFDGEFAPAPEDITCETNLADVPATPTATDGCGASIDIGYECCFEADPFQVTRTWSGMDTCGRTVSYTQNNPIAAACA